MQTDKIYDTNYASIIPQGGAINHTVYDETKRDNQNRVSKKKPKKKGFSATMDKIVGSIFHFQSKKNTKPTEQKTNKSSDAKKFHRNEPVQHKLETILNLPDEEYEDKLLDPEMRKYLTNAENDFIAIMDDFKSHIAPSYREVKPGKFMLSGVYGKNFFIQKYPSYLDFLRIRDILGMYGKRDITWYIYPEDNATIKGMLKNRVTALKAEIHEAQNKGITIDTDVEIQYKDIEMIRQKLATREERYLPTGMYVNLYTEEENKLAEETKKFEQKISGFGIRSKPSIQRMDDGMKAVSPLGIDDLGIVRSMVTTSLGGSFPFISNDLVDHTGIFYGINSHSGSLVIFDRYKKGLTNSNSVVLATSGAGKSFAVKLEILRYLMIDVDVIVIDPENEYKTLCEKVGGEYINIAVNSNQYVNPFDMPPKIEDRDYKTGDLLRGQIMSLIGLFSVLLGGLSPTEEAIMDKAIQSVYSLQEITFDNDTMEGKTPPLMEDLLYILESMKGGNELSIKLSKYVTGTFGSLFNNYTNVDVNNKLTVFSVRDLEEALRTPGMYNVLNFIRTSIRAKKRKRLLIVDEARIMMQHDMSANFMFGLIKRARKYGLGVTTITQDVEDFVRSPYGKPIISNSSMQLLLKQSTVSIKSLDKVFGLSDAEKQRLVSANIGEGLLFAGNQHVGIKIVASPFEKDFITTDV